MDKVSIVIPVHNGERYLKECIDSALDQTYKNTEVIVVDDGSTDKTRDIILGYGDTVRGIFIPHTDRFVGRVFNAGIKAMSGQWFKELEADDRLFPWAVESMMSRVHDKEDTIYYADVDWIDKDGKFYFGLREKDRNNWSLDEFNTTLFMHNIGNGISVLVHKSALDKHGLFNESTMHEDYYMRLDWCILQGCRMTFIDKVVAEYRVHKESYTSTRPIQDLIDEDKRIKLGILKKMHRKHRDDMALRIARMMYDERQYPELFTKPSLARIIGLRSFNQIVYNVR